MTDHQADLIVADPDVVHGQARVRGTRIPVSVIRDCLAAGLSEDEILRQYPTLTVEGVRRGNHCEDDCSCSSCQGGWQRWPPSA